MSWRHHAAALFAFAACLSGGASASAASYEVVYAFAGGADGANPYADLTAVNGLLYGGTAGGGGDTGACPQGCGTLYAIDPSSGKETVVYRFAGGGDGVEPDGALVEVGGLLYGTTIIGGGSRRCGAGCGTVFSFDPSTGTEKVLHAFQSERDGAYPQLGLVEQRGRLYGITATGGGARCAAHCGTVFSIDPATGAFATVYGLNGGRKDGRSPGGLLGGRGKVLYGETFEGGDGSNTECYRRCGTVFRLDPASGRESLLFSFGGAGTGDEPEGGLILSGGKLYGTTESGGGGQCMGPGCGVVFSIDPASGTEKVLFRFPNGASGVYPTGGLIALGGKLYGTTSQGGGDDDGVVFSLDLSNGGEVVMHSFAGGADGAVPQSGLVDVGGILFGTAAYGGPSANCQFGCGVVYSIKP